MRDDEDRTEEALVRVRDEGAVAADEKAPANAIMEQRVLEGGYADWDPDGRRMFLTAHGRAFLEKRARRRAGTVARVIPLTFPAKEKAKSRA